MTGRARQSKEYATKLSDSSASIADAIAEAQASATAAAADAVQTAADRVQTGLDRTATTASAAAADADAIATAADRVATAADRVQTAADRVQTGADVVAADADRVAAEAAQAAATLSAAAASTSATAAAASAGSIPSLSQGPDKIGMIGNDGYFQWYINPASIVHPQMDAHAVQVAKLTYTVAPSYLDKIGQVGSDNYTQWEITPTRLRHREFALSKLAQVRAQKLATASDMATLAERIGIHIIGQSNGAGNSATPPISTTGSAYADMFNGGSRPDQGNTVNANVLAGARASLTALVESTVSTSFSQFLDGGETPLSACVEMIVQLLRDEDGIDLLNLGQKFICASDAHGGSGITGMLSTSGASPYVYLRYKESMEKARDLANAASKSYVPGALLFWQGETDNSNNMAQATYAGHLATLKADVQVVSDAIMGFNRRVPVAMVQVATHTTYSLARPNVALAQLAICVSDEQFLFVGPTYPFPQANATPGQLHHSNVGQKWAGAYFGLALKRLLFDQVKQAPLTPVFTAQGSRIIGRFPVDADKRILGGVLPGVPSTDMTVLSNWGVTATAADGTTTKALTNPRIGGRDTIVWDAPEIPADAWKIRCAWSGNTTKAWGNIAESDPIIFDPNGLRLPVQRWMPIAEVTLS